MQKQLLVGVIVVFAVLHMDCCFAIGQNNNPEVTTENWLMHPRILEIRNLYGDIQSKLANKTFKTKQKNYSSLPRSCRGTYPIEYLMISLDKGGHVWQYTVAQRISHDDLLTTRNYYDERGQLRFVYMTNESTEYATIENRVYIDGQGKVFWDVKTEAGKSKFGEITQDPDPWTIHRITNAGLIDEFESAKVECRK